MCNIYGGCSRRTQKETGTRGGQRGQGNFELAANSDYNSRGSADPRESLRKRRISKLALTAHKVLSTPVSRISRLFPGKTNLKQPLIFRHIFPVARNDNFYRYPAQQGKKMPFKSILRAVRASFKILCLVRLGDERLSANHVHR